MSLVRQVPVRGSVGTSAERRRHVRLAAQVTVVRVALLGSLFAPAVYAMTEDEPRPSADITTEIVRRYAFEAFPLWAMDHQNRACPDSLAELSPFISRTHALDDWGNPLELRCGNGYRGAYIRSAGADGRFETADDITSNDR
jgi:hypothetical protein